MTPTCSVVTEIARLEALEPAWTELLAHSDTNELMLSPIWLLPWWDVFGPLGGRRLQVATFTDGGRLVGLAPLLARTHWYPPAIPFRRLELLGSGEPEEDEICSEYLDVIAERGAESAVAEAFAGALAGGSLGGWDELVLTAMSDSSPLLPQLAAACERAGFSATREPFDASAYIELPSSWSAYLEGLTSPSRYLITRSLRDFDKWAEGAAELKVSTSAAELEEGRRALIDLHTERWSGGGAFASARFNAFHDAVMPRLLTAGALELMWLTVRGQAVAAAYNLIWNDKVYFYQTGRRLDLPKRIRPGIVIQAHAIRRAIELGRREYDFLGAGLRYKRQLASATRPLARLRVVRQKDGLRERARLLAAGVKRAILPETEAPAASRDDAPADSDSPVAVLTGDLNMLRCFASTDVRTVVVSSDPENPCFFSRHCGQRRLIADPATSPEDALRDLIQLGKLLRDRPVLYYGDDASLLLLSRHRGKLGQLFRFLMPDAALVEALVDKTRFVGLARQLELLVPRSIASTEIGSPADAVRLVRTPCVLKPFCHIGWHGSQAIAALGGKPFKALRADDAAQLSRAIEQLRSFSSEFVIQEYIPGGEDQVYSFHAYVDAGRRPLGHYVGKKIRTYPKSAGISTYLELVDEPELTRQGLEILGRLGLVGPAKLDFKRDPRSGRFYLLEVNPRFSLWNHLGAACGVNLPLIAYRDLAGKPRAPETAARTGVRWLSFGDDARAFVRDYAPAGELSLPTWLLSLRGPKVYDVFSWDDTSPFFMTLMHSLRDRRRVLFSGGKK